MTGLLIAVLMLSLGAVAWLGRGQWARLRRAQAEHHLYDGGAFALLVLDAGGKICAANDAALRLLGAGREALLREDLLRFHDMQELAVRANALSHELSTMVMPGFDVLIAKARLGTTDENDWTLVRRDGSRVPAHLAISALRDAAGAVSGYMVCAYDIGERRRREQYIQHIAQHDGLTHLPNRMLLQDRLQVALVQARQHGEQVGVLMVDLDHFKRINDSLGHHTGDQLLVTVAERLRGCVRDGDTVARMGGDEFAIVLADVKNSGDVQQVAQSVVDTLSRPMRVGAHELQVTPSVGVSRFPEDGGDVGTLLKHADTALYRAKAEGRSRLRMFSADLLHVATEKLELEGALRQALARGELVMHYEPQVSLASGQLIGMEALVRWQHPERGLISPAVFIPVAEESGLIVQLGEWTLRTACRETRQLQERSGRPLTVSVNLSPRQFGQARLVDMVRSALAESGLAPQHLVLEVTEGVLMQHADETIALLAELRALGVSIAVDDFGTGYSSLSYISRFPVNVL
ncbi:MAG TPA: diguanylate cyclase, partial [Nevskiaceae bacterium]|nr:diguanylate cyclase [Nevskiaceae bacterium]